MLTIVLVLAIALLLPTVIGLLIHVGKIEADNQRLRREIAGLLRDASERYAQSLRWETSVEEPQNKEWIA